MAKGDPYQIFGDSMDAFDIGPSSPRTQDFRNILDFRESIREDIALIVHKESQQLALAIHKESQQLAFSITKELERLSNVLHAIAKHPSVQTAVFELDPVTPKLISKGSASKGFLAMPPPEVHAEPPKTHPPELRQLRCAHSVTPAPVFRDIELEVERAFQGAEDGNVDLVRSFLNAGGDPNAKLAAFKGKKKVFSDCSLLPVSAMGEGDSVEVVRLLMEARAKVDGTYSFAAGSINMPWTGAAQDAAVHRGNLEILKELAKRKANLHQLSSNRANLVWQTAYVGNRQILDYLLQHEVSHKIPAQSQDDAGVSLTPLHVATVQGHTPIVEVLLDAKADFRRKNEKGHSPLVDAIVCGRADEIRLLISHGASLLDTMTGKLGQSEDQVFDCLFAERNPVLVHAAALGLHGQDRQVGKFSTEHVLQVMQDGDSDAVIAILKAIFRRREIIYRGEHHEKISLRTAMMPRAAHLKHINVIQSVYRFLDIAEMFTQRTRPDQSVKEFFESLFPRETPWSDFRHYHMTSVSVYESLVQDFHTDIRVVYAIACISSFDPILETKQCSAIITANWKAHKKMFNAQFVIQVVWVLALFIISVLLLDSCPSNDPCPYDGRKHYKLQVLAAILIPLVIFETVLEVTVCFVYASYSWLYDYARNFNNYAAFAVIISHLWVLSNIIFWINQDNYYNRIVFAACCLINWLYLLHTMTPLRFVGIQVIPILFAICEIAPFICVMIFFLAGMWNGYLALHFGDLHVVDAFTEIMNFALIEDIPDHVEPPYPDIASGEIHRRFTFVLVLVSTFMLPIILMNTLIAAVCNSYSNGIANIETLYQSRRSHKVFRLMARKRFFHALKHFLFGTVSDSPPATLWYCVTAKAAGKTTALQSQRSEHDWAVRTNLKG